MNKQRTSSSTRTLLASAAAGCIVASTMAAQQGDVIHVHDPAIIKEGDTYYIFSTGHGVPIRTSTDLKEWTLSGRVFEEDVPAWAAEEIEGTRFPWAPDISYFNDRYHLYYSVSTFGSQHSVIGLATTPTLDPGNPEYGWTDHGRVVDSRRGRDGFNAIDANLVLDEDGQPWLSWGSFHWGNIEPAGIMLVPLDLDTGMPKDDAEPISIAGRPGIRSIEAPFIVRRGEHFYLFVSFDHCCRGVNSTYNIRVGRSDSVNGIYVDREGVAMTDGGGTLVLEGDGDRIRGPGHNSILMEGEDAYLVHHFYDAANNGLPTLQIRALSWEDGWPVAGAPVVDPSSYETAVPEEESGENEDASD